MSATAPQIDVAAARVRRLMLATTILLLACIGIAAGLLQESGRRQHWLEDSQAVQLRAAELRTTVLGAGRRVQQEVSEGSDLDRAIYVRRQVARDQLEALRGLVTDPPQVARLAALAPLIETRMDLLAELMQATASMPGMALAPSALGGPARAALAPRIEAALDEFDAEQEAVRATREAAYDRVTELAGATLIGSILMALALHTLALHMARHELRQRREAERAATQSAAALQGLIAELDGRVAQRTAALNAQNAALGQMHSRLSMVSSQLLKAAEDERRALARELHDDIGQQLAALKMNLQLMTRYPQGRQAPLADSVALVDACIAQVRSQALRLRPALLDELGLAAALHWHARQQAERSGVTVDVDVTEAAADALERTTETWRSAVFRIVQEALRNAVAHADASRVEVRLALEADQLVLRVLDDGVGLAPVPLRAGANMGLMTMRERTELQRGSFSLGPRPLRGTEVCCKWPLREVTDPEAAAQAAAA